MPPQQRRRPRAIISRRQLLAALAGIPIAAGALLGQSAPAYAANTVYLTIDDGYVGLAAKLNALNDLGVKGTFFLTGQAISANARTIRQLVNSGHRLANHTHDHARLTRLAYGGIAWEIQECEKTARRVAGVSTVPLFRPPYGAVNALVRQVASDLGYRTILWNSDTADYSGASAAYIAGKIANGGIVLLHTQGRNTVAALYRIVPSLLEQGYTFATL